MRPSAPCQCADLIQILFEKARIKYPEFDHAFPSPLDQPTVNQFSEVVARQSLADAETLVRELADYRVKISASGHDSYDAREGQHDDLILAVALAAWTSERGRPRCWASA